MFTQTRKQQIAITSTGAKLKVVIGWDVAGVGLETYARIDLGDGLSGLLPEDCIEVQDFFKAVSFFDLSKMPKEVVKIGVMPSKAVCEAVTVYTSVELGGQQILELTHKYPFDEWMYLSVLSLTPTADGWVLSNDAPKRSLRDRLLARLGF